MFGAKRKEDEPPKYIQEISERLKKASSRDEMYEILDGAVEKIPQFKAVETTSFAGDGYNFFCTLETYTRRYDIKKINAESDKTIIDIIPIKNSDMCVVFSKSKE